jgi:hypothetical protein
MMLPRRENLDVESQYLVVTGASRIRISARPKTGLGVLVENEDGKIVVQARFIQGWRQLMIIPTEDI